VAMTTRMAQPQGGAICRTRPILALCGCGEYASAPLVNLECFLSKEVLMSTAPKPQPSVQDPVTVDTKHYKVELEEAFDQANRERV